ncbi:hypothetical protein D187_004866 [Cystobacter fuscus DSM 2262]|uniref:DUF1330 domain-containing protein n=1 Tax=Cystobacter fuscus (strain ATCC 25194 / DSM 2262 / NBRC 100088 / M29) TaxID=1242864 RepID=S9P3B7_CYSF2|nr:hypothetical protein D187_004866 [Cystobacter fuscus DSM 2262]
MMIDITVKDAETYERYKQLAPPTIAAYGGRYLARGGATETLEGTWSPTRIALLEFPTVERAREWWNSPEYAPAKAMRQASSSTDLLLVEGLPPGMDPASKK